MVLSSADSYVDPVVVGRCYWWRANPGHAVSWLCLLRRALFGGWGEEAARYRPIGVVAVVGFYRRRRHYSLGLVVPERDAEPESFWAACCLAISWQLSWRWISINAAAEVMNKKKTSEVGTSNRMRADGCAALFIR